MFVCLARPGDFPGVVEGQAVELPQAHPHRLEIGDRQWGLLILELPRDDQQVVIHNVELVQQAHVGIGHVSHKHRFFVRQERVSAGLALGDLRPSFPLELLNEMHLEADPIFLYELNPCGNSFQGSGMGSGFGGLEYGLPECVPAHAPYFFGRLGFFGFGAGNAAAVILTSSLNHSPSSIRSPIRKLGFAPG